jgi:hypothetical protein
MSDKPVIEFHGLYKERWGDLISPSAISHPAKFSHGLIRRIYEYALEQGYVKPNNKILDPFGGVGLGSFYCAMNGMAWDGCELEPSFVTLGYKNFLLWAERFWCTCESESYLYLLRDYIREREKRSEPETKEQDRSILQPEVQKQLSLFGEEVITRTNPIDEGTGQDNTQEVQSGISGQPYDESLQRLVQETKAQRIRAQAKREDEGTFCKQCGKVIVQFPILYQGDSRHLASILAQQVESLVSSPPYVESLHLNESREKELERMKQRGLESTIAKASRDGSFRGDANKGYSSTLAQLGNMPVGDLADALLASPPYIDSIDHAPGNKNWTGAIPGNIKQSEYGQADNQLGSLPSGNLDALISSSPFADSIGSDDPDKRGGLYRDERRRNDKNLTGSYRTSRGQLGTMKDEGFDDALQADGLIGSPPYSNAPVTSYDSNQMGEDFRLTGKTPRQRTGGKLPSEQYNIDNPNQLANLPDKGFDMSVSSPSFAGNTGGRGEASRNGIDPALFDRSSGGMKKGTGDSSENLDHLSMTGFEASVSSPGFGGSEISDNRKTINETIKARGTAVVNGWGTYSKDNVSAQSGQTFWAASKEILLQCWQLLKSGGESVPDNEDIDFCDC